MWLRVRARPEVGGLRQADGDDPDQSRAFVRGSA